MPVRRLLFALVTAVAMVTTAGLVAVPPANAGAGTEAKLLQRINTAREHHGLRPLVRRGSLSDYARRHSRAMAHQGYLFHTATFSVVCCWASIGENVAVGFNSRMVHRMLMRSPVHRHNILDPRKREVGIGTVWRGGRLWVTQVFREPR